ncbi:MAG: hypothetical protein SH819_03055 [Cytophagales bacterium]|nr:hypothetical protein [Cytophagales bacterium]
MKTTSAIFVITFACFSAFGQTNFGFSDGVILTKQGDSLKCLIEMAVTYEDKVAYKKTPSDFPLQIPTKEIHAMQTKYKYYLNIPVGKEEKLMSLMVDGKARLFTHVILNAGPSKPMGGGTAKMYQPPTVTYVVEKDGDYHEIRKKDFVNQMTKLMGDSPQIVQKIYAKEYTFEDLEKLVKDYNSSN